MRIALLACLGVVTLASSLVTPRDAGALCMARPYFSPQQRQALAAESAGRLDEAAHLYKQLGYRGRHLALRMWSRAAHQALRREQFAQAASRLQRAHELQPTNARLGLERARAHAFANQPAEALRLLDSLPQAFAALPEAKAARARALNLMGRRAEASRWASEALAMPLPELDRRMLLQSGTGVRFTGPGALGRL